MFKSLMVAALLGAGGSAWATPSKADLCNRWLGASDIHYVGRLTPAQIATEANLVKLEATIDRFQLSEHRLDPANYALLLEYFQGVFKKLEMGKAQKQAALDLNIKKFEQDFNVLSRFLSFGRGARFKRESITPLEKEIKVLNSAIERLKEIRLAIEDDIADMTKDDLIRDALIIFGVMLQDYDSSGALVLAVKLMGIEGNLESELEKSAKIFDFFYEMDGVSEQDAWMLTGAVLGGANPSQAELERVARLWERIYELSEDEALTTSLTVIAYANKIKGDAAKTIYEIFEAVEKEVTVDDVEELYSFVYYFASVGRIPLAGEIAPIVGLIEKVSAITGDIGIEESFLLGGILNVDKGVFNEARVKEMTDSFHKLQEENGFNSVEAALFSNAIYSVEGGDSEALREEVTSIYNRFVESADYGVGDMDAVLLTLEAFRRNHGLTFDILKWGLRWENSGGVHSVNSGGGGSSSGFDSGESSNTLLDPLQYAVTGDIVNLDGNPLTPL